MENEDTNAPTLGHAAEQTEEHTVYPPRDEQIAKLRALVARAEEHADDGALDMLVWLAARAVRTPEQVAANKARREAEAAKEKAERAADRQAFLDAHPATPKQIAARAEWLDDREGAFAKARAVFAARLPKDAPPGIYYCGIGDDGTMTPHAFGSTLVEASEWFLRNMAIWFDAEFPNERHPDWPDVTLAELAASCAFVRVDASRPDSELMREVAEHRCLSPIDTWDLDELDGGEVVVWPEEPEPERVEGLDVLERKYGGKS